MLRNRYVVVAILLLIAGLQLLREQRPAGIEHSLESNAVTAPASNSSDALREAFEQRRSNVQIAGSGVVTSLLKDDNTGSRHQRFIVRLPHDQTLLIAHNVDLAPRIDALQVGDDVRFFGEYEWNDKGGVLHWTHDDPQGRHVAGWIEHEGKRYQ
jgi:hypothetical protein